MPAHDVHARGIAWSGAAIALGVVLAVGAVFLLLRLWNTPPGADRARPGDPLAVPPPALQSAPQPDLAQYRAQKQQILESSGWVDRERGIARIPIATAMDILVRSRAAATSPAQERP
ncbi:hypothetical protein [Variovorax soli]|uniref:Uncharacterized protein n=1 Tax=Variovorax soli TaxID=376815 RepID=A0ABU1NDM8_9BURK|nr:hypothetical protein [Variovorax soli]MDR6536526.1 hypothetical protein [Variovorax soli]